MRILHFGAVLPAGELESVSRQLRSLAGQQGYQFLSLLLEETTAAFKSETETLPTHLQRWIPPFTSILGFADLHVPKHQPLVDAIEAALLCVLEIGLLLRYFLENPDQSKFENLPTWITAHGYGRFPAAAIMISSSLEDIPFAAGVVVRMALRLVSVTEQISQMIEARDPDKRSESWAVLIKGLDPNTITDEVESFNRSTKSPRPSKIFVSVVQPNSTIISGPPTRLKSLLQTSEGLVNSQHNVLPIYGGLGHAPHVYTKMHCRHVAGCTIPQRVKLVLSKAFKMYSTSNGQPIEAEDVTEHFEMCIADLLLNKAYIQLMMDNLLRDLASPEYSQVQHTMFIFGHTPLTQALTNSVQDKNSSSPEIELINLLNWKNQSGDRRVSAPPPLEDDPRTSFVITISAKSKLSLQRKLEVILLHIEEHPDISPAHLSYTTAIQHDHHQYRFAVSGANIREISLRLRDTLDSSKIQDLKPTSPPSVAFAFSGQGAYYHGVGKVLFRIHPYFRAQILQLEGLCLRHGYPSFLPAIEGDLPEGHRLPPVVTQLAIVCVGIALGHLLESLGVHPSVTVGASVGDYPALCISGVLSASDAIFLAGERALILQRACTPHTHTMLAVHCSVEQVRNVAPDQAFEVSCIIGRDEICISESIDEISEIRSALERQGIETHQLNVPFAFHSTQMEPALEEFEAVAAGALYKPPRVPFLSSLLTDVVADGDVINASYMRRATRETMNIYGALRSGHEKGVMDSNTVWVDIGPHPICLPFIRQVTPDVVTTAATLRNDEGDWKTFSSMLGRLYESGVQVDWNEWHRPFQSSIRVVPLPAPEFEESDESGD